MPSLTRNYSLVICSEWTFQSQVSQLQNSRYLFQTCAVAWNNKYCNNWPEKDEVLCIKCKILCIWKFQTNTPVIFTTNNKNTFHTQSCHYHVNNKNPAHFTSSVKNVAKKGIQITRLENLHSPRHLFEPREFPGNNIHCLQNEIFSWMQIMLSHIRNPSCKIYPCLDKWSAGKLVYSTRAHETRRGASVIRAKSEKRRLTLGSYRNFWFGRIREEFRAFSYVWRGFVGEMKEKLWRWKWGWVNSVICMFE